jgi:hypothetical protein
MFDMMTHLMICDIGLLYMCKVITCLCVCCNFCMPVLEVPQPERQTKKATFLKKIIMFISYVPRLTASGNPEEHKELCSLVS